MFANSLSRRLLSVSVLLGAMFVAPAFAGDAAPAVRKFDIAAQSAATALNEFARQADITLVFSYQLVAGTQTKSVKGDLSVADALARMLDGTSLSYQQIGKNTVAINSREAGAQTISAPPVSHWTQAAATPVDLHLAQVDAAQDSPREDRKKTQSDVVKKKTEEAEVEVTGSRIRSVLGEATVQPVYTYTSKDLERLGVQQMTDLNNYIPQLPTLAWESTPQTGFVNLANVGGRTNFNGGLRGLGDTATLLLVNGRRVPKLGAADSADAYDISGIPMTAVDRIEVLTDGASAIYGADAAAGVINIILKKNYSGTIANVTYGNTFESDTGFTNLQLSTAYSTEKFSANLMANWSHTNAFSPADRWFSASNDRRPFGGTDGRGTIPGGTGIIRNVAVANLPGLNSREATIPAGSDGVNLTIADFANAGPRADPFDSPKYTVYGDQDMKGGRLNLEYEFTPWMTAFVEGAHNEQSSFRHDVPRTIAVNLPAGYPGNPFGVPIQVRRVYWEMQPYQGAEFDTKNDSVLAGLRGSLAHDWRYEGGIQKEKTKYSATGVGAYTYFNGSGPIQAAVNSADPAMHPILLNDGTMSSPNSAAIMNSFLTVRDYGEQPETLTYDFKADGPVWKLPAGDIRAAVGAEYRDETSHFVIPANNDLGRLGSARSRSSIGVFAEVQMPLVSAAQNIPLVNKLSVNVSARRDDYNDFGAKLVPRYGMLYYPIEWLALRASYGEGYKVPNLSSIYSPRTEGPVSIGQAANVFDPKRGGENIFVNVVPPATGYSIIEVFGGNPDLRPELSRNINLGLLVEVPFVSGLSFGVDYYDINQTDRIGGDLVNIIANFEERITRAPPSPEDIARGYAGLITQVDITPINIASYHVTGLDYQARYSHSFDPLGTLDLRFTATQPKIGETKSSPDAPAVSNTPNSSYWRGTGMAALTRGSFTVGTTVSYTSSYLGRYFPGYFYFNNHILNDPLTMVDANASYDFGQGGAGGGWLRSLTENLRIGLNLYNVLGKDPPLDPVSHTASYTVDPRGRRYQFALQKSF